jgi:DNA-binding HxlR family transcriptional regulator
MHNNESEPPLTDIEIRFGNELPDEVLATLRLISKKWSLPILYSLHERSFGFSELKLAIGETSSISSNMLSRALDDLQALKLIEKRIISNSPMRVEYSSTVLGKDFCDLCQVIGGFGKKYLIETNNGVNSLK